MRRRRASPAGGAYRRPSRHRAILPTIARHSTPRFADDEPQRRQLAARLHQLRQLRGRVDDRRDGATIAELLDDLLDVSVKHRRSPRRPSARRRRQSARDCDCRRGWRPPRLARRRRERAPRDAGGELMPFAPAEPHVVRRTAHRELLERDAIGMSCDTVGEDVEDGGRTAHRGRHERAHSQGRAFSRKGTLEAGSTSTRIGPRILP